MGLEVYMSDLRVHEPAKILNKNFMCVMATAFLHCVGHYSVNPLVATYTKYLNTSAQLTGFLTGMFFAVSLAMRPFAGPAATKLDKRKLLIIVFLLGAVANLGYALFHSTSAFIAFRFLSGVQYSLFGSINITLAVKHLPKDKLASGLGILGIGSAVGNAVSPSIGDAILRFGTNLRGDSFGFTLMFLFGSFSFAIAVIPGIILAPDKKSKADTASTGKWYKNIFAIHAMPPAFVLLLAMIPYAMINTYMFEFGKEQGIAHISLFYLVFAASLTISRPLSGYLTDRLGINKVIIPVLVLFSFSLFVIGSSNTFWMAFVGAVMAAVGFGSSQPSFQTMCMQSEKALRQGVAGNTLYMGMDLGLFLGPYLGGLVYARSDYAVMFKTGVVPVVLAIICLIFVIPMHKRRLDELG